MSTLKAWSPPMLHMLCTSADQARNGGPSAAAIDAGTNNYANDPVS